MECKVAVVQREDWSWWRFIPCSVSVLPRFIQLIRWMVAQMRPPSLKAIIAWEGWSDAYRDIWFQGGIPETSFAPGWLKGIQNGRNETEDVIRMQREHPLLDDLWKIRQVDLPAIDVPAFIVLPQLCF